MGVPVASAGGQGFADVAVTCLTRVASPHSQQTEEAQGPPLSPNLTWQEQQGHCCSQLANRLISGDACGNVIACL